MHLYVYTCVCKYCAIHLADNPPAPLTQQVWSGGMGLVFLLHVQADVAIFLLVWMEGRRKARLVDATD